ncbi:hypothetical protein ACIRD3_34130 [Kitasatospora sp. NPDC093550]|uniref:hypothetical protein n=1 Tax=Kitasatospora sp. NPDC093550 TaxID=3364089 RepID=UPI003809E147
MFDPDHFISWMAQQGSGPLAALIRHTSWAAGCDRRPATQWLSRIEALGAVTIDWRTGRWSANACEITDLPGNTQTAVLTGARPVGPGFYQEHGAVTAVPQEPEESGIPLPTAVWLQYSERSRLHEFAASTGSAAVPCAAESAARSLRPFTLGPAAAPPARDSPAERFDPVAGRFVPVALGGSWPAPGLYRFTQYNRLQRYSLLHRPRLPSAPGRLHTPDPFPEQTWHSVDRRAGIHHVIPPAAFPLRWKADRTGSRSAGTLGRMTVDRRAPLPLAHERAAVLCTGLASLRTAGTEHYDGVPFFIADRIARTLHRRLETE